jgi:hypothetical protein
MNIPPVIVTQTCVHCGALAQTKGGKCWLCYEKLEAPNPYADSINPYAASSAIPSESETPTAMTTLDIIFSILLGLCAILTIVVAIGLGIQDTGTLIPFAILIGPAWVVTAVRGLLPKRKTGIQRPASLLLTFLVSLVVTILASVVFIVVAAIMLFIACIGAFNTVGK